MIPAAEREPHLRIALAPGLGPILTKRLLEQLGSADAICHASADQLARIQGISLKTADRIRRGIHEAPVEREYELIEKHGASLVSIEDAAYPQLLKFISDPPVLLYIRGDLQPTDAVSLAIVGARKCTSYGQEQAGRLGSLCAQAGLTIISGGARGIDTAAHHGALRIGGRTIAVLGCGLGHCYPPENADLFEAIASGQGAMISEMPMQAPPIAENFPRRNRIISGLSMGVLVVEASHRSGALITARLAAEEHHREVMALPGRVDSPASAGCHKILREGWATLVTNPTEILDCLGEAGQTLKAAMAEQAGDAAPTAGNLFDQPALQGDAAKLYDSISADPLPIDSLCHSTGIAIGSIQALLMQLQLSGLIERLPGNRVKRRKR